MMIRIARRAIHQFCVHLLRAEGREQAGEHEIKKACAEDSDAGVGKGLGGGKTLGFTHRDDGGIPAEEREGRAEERRDPHLGQEVEQESAETCEKQGGRHGETGDDRDQDRGSEHGEHVLEAEGKHLPGTEGTGIVDGLLLL